MRIKETDDRNLLREWMGEFSESKIKGVGYLFQMVSYQEKVLLINIGSLEGFVYKFAVLDAENRMFVRFCS